ncbi:MAG: host attachment protein [Hyphomicrobiaceae bacterium]
MKPIRTWILVADASRSKVYEHRGPGHGLEAVAGLAMATEHRKSSEIGSDKPGRSFESVGAVRHAVEPHSDPARIEEQRFAASLLERLNQEAAAKRFDRLVLVAPPTMLGDLRAALPSGIAPLVMATIDKDLTKIPDHKLAGHLSDILPV